MQSSPSRFKENALCEGRRCDIPLRKGASRAVVSENIREMIQAGHPQKQAVAAALRTADQAQGKRPAKPVDLPLKSKGPLPAVKGTKPTAFKPPLPKPKAMVKKGKKC